MTLPDRGTSLIPGGGRGAKVVRGGSALLLSALALALLCAPAAAAPPVYQGRAVALGLGPIVSWDQAGVMQPSIVLEGGLYKMWYLGTDGLSQGLGYAVSRDGQNWNRVISTALNVSGPGWTGPVEYPVVISSPSGGYEMWFSGEPVGGSIGRASSSDGVSWSGATVVLRPGPTGSWDEGGIGEPTVVHYGSEYWMWYVGVDRSGGNSSIGLAKSPDGVAWSKHPANPVLSPVIGDWSGAGLNGPSVAVSGDATFAMWLVGSDGSSGRIGYAISFDGASWSQPVVVLDKGAPATADGSDIGDPVALGGADGCLWYSGFDGNNWRILLATPAPPPPSSPIATPATAALAFSAGIGAVGAASFMTSDRFKYAFFAIPLTLRLVKEKSLDQFVRGQIYQYVRENPGDYYSSIMTAIGATNGNLTYHLHILERQGFINSVKDGRHVRFYPKGMPVPQKEGIRFSPLQIRMLELVDREPGITQSSLARALNTARQTITYNVWALAEEGFLKVKKNGRETYLFIPTEDETT